VIPGYGRMIVEAKVKVERFTGLENCLSYQKLGID